MSTLDRRRVETAWFQDSYCAPVSRPQASVVEDYLAIFAHHPAWMKAVLIARNQFASLCGLDAPTAGEVMNPQARDHYAVGDKIGVWPIFSMTQTELIVGRDNKHLDFRLSVLRTVGGERAAVVVSTVCTVHNLFGKIYLFFVVPFHKWGVQRLIANALKSGRL